MYIDISVQLSIVSSEYWELRKKKLKIQVVSHICFGMLSKNRRGFSFYFLQSFFLEYISTSFFRNAVELKMSALGKCIYIVQEHTCHDENLFLFPTMF